jgi:hypothetical protein
MVNSQEQNRFLDNGYLFGLVEDITDVQANICQNDDSILISSTHNGYERLNLGANHIREIEFSITKKKLKIIDKFDAKAKKKTIFILRNHKGLSVSEGMISSAYFKMHFKGANNIKCNGFYYSSSYGHIEKNGCLKIEVSFDKELVTFIDLL